MRTDRLPLTYDECRARLTRAAGAAGVEVRAHPITARGPAGQALTIDSVWFGATHPRRVLTVMSGVHGVEGFIGSAIQCQALGRFAERSLPEDTAILVIHAVNPWGMAWWRRQNESNVDLNRNWRRNTAEPIHNNAYDELHPLACPDGDELPSINELLVAAAAVVERHGLEWVRDGITRGQYRHPDGLHFGGDRTEASTLVIEGIVADRLAGVERALTVDLHTGHGPHGELTLLSDQPLDSPQDQFLRTHFGEDRVEATVDNPNARTGVKSGQIANGFADLLGDATCFATSVEFGTASDDEQLVATYLESWVDRHGDRSRPRHAEIVWDYRCCFTPDDPEWETRCIEDGGELVDRALAAVLEWVC